RQRAGRRDREHLRDPHPVPGDRHGGGHPAADEVAGGRVRPRGAVRRDPDGHRSERVRERRVSVDYNPYRFETQHNPYPVYARLRDEEPVYYNPDLDFWALSRYADVLAAHKDPTTFDNGHGVTL